MVRRSAFRRALRAAAWAALLGLASLAAAQEQAVMARQHGEWLSGVILGQAPLRYRYLTEHLDGAAYVSLSVDVLAGDCQKRFVTLNVHVPEPLAGDFLSEGLQGAVRVDRHAARKLVYRAGTQGGRNVIFMYLMEIEGEDALWKELAAGEVVRFRFPTERKEYLVRFSLQGFPQAQQRALTLCRAPSVEADRPYFQK